MSPLWGSYSGDHIITGLEPRAMVYRPYGAFHRKEKKPSHLPKWGGFYFGAVLSEVFGYFSLKKEKASDLRHSSF